MGGGFLRISGGSSVSGFSGPEYMAQGPGDFSAGAGFGFRVQGLGLRGPMLRAWGLAVSHNPALKPSLNPKP